MLVRRLKKRDFDPNSITMGDIRAKIRVAERIMQGHPYPHGVP